MTTSPQLSVIIPTYNRAALLGKTIESVFAQTFTDYEIIVVDDGSADRTKEAVEHLLKTQPIRERQVRYFFQRNQGKSVALNRGLSEARGEWIAFLDSDDLWLPRKIEKQITALRQYAPGARACFTDARYINNPAYPGTVFGHARKRYQEATGTLGGTYEYVANPFGIFMQTLVMHSSLLADVGQFDPGLCVIQDIDFIFRVATHTQLCFVNEPLVLIDRTPDRPEGLIELLLRNEERRLREEQKMYDKWLQLSAGRSTRIQKAIRSHLRGTHSEWANWYLTKKKYREARHALSEAARVELTPGIAAKWCLAVGAPALARSVVLQRSRVRRDRKAFPAMESMDPAGKSPSNRRP